MSLLEILGALRDVTVIIGMGLLTYVIIKDIRREL